MTSSLDMIRGRSNVVTMTNNSGGGLVAGDVCIQDATGDEYVTTTTSAASTAKIFIAAETIANGAAGKFYESGYCPLVNVSASATRGYFLFTHTVAKQATTSATYAGGAFGKILKAGTSPSAVIYSSTAQVAGAGTIGGSTGSTDNAVIRADGTGGATIQSSLAAIDDSGGINIPTGQTYNINGSPHTHAGGGASTADTFVTGQGTNSDLSAQIQIPSLSGSWDKKPGGANDDEFDTTNASALTGWTAFGTPSAANENTTALSRAYLLSSAGAGEQWRGFYKAHGAGTAFTVISKMDTCRMGGAGGPRVYGVFLSHGAPGKMAGIQVEVSAGNVLIFGGRIFTDQTTYGSDAVTGVLIALGAWYDGPVWCKMVVTDSSHVASYYSTNGVIWTLLNAAWDTTLGAGNTDYVGIGVDSHNAAVVAEAAWDYVRFS